MRILVGWEAESEAETIGLLLDTGENSAQVTTDADTFLSLAKDEPWDAVLMSLDFPSSDKAFALFEMVRNALPDAPILGACFQGQVAHLAEFLLHGLHTWVSRDSGGEFIFLLSTVIESAHAAMQAQRSRMLAERLREEIDSVRRLQESVIPRDLPSSDEYRVVARYEAAQIRVRGNQPLVMAGGDYYDAFSMDDQNFILLVGDAAGHGVKACMSIMTMHTLIHMIRDHRYQNTAEFVTEVNRRLSKNAVVQDEGGFITLLYCALDTSNHQLQWTSAGHPMPLVQDLATNEIRPLASDEASGLPLGIDGDWQYELLSAAIPPNSRLLLYSDGLAEAFPEGGDQHAQFDLEGITATLQATARLPLQEAMERLFADSAAFAGGGRADDTSIVLVERR